MYSSDSLRAILEMEIVNAHYRGARKASHLIPNANHLPTSTRANVEVSTYFCNCTDFWSGMRSLDYVLLRGSSPDARFIIQHLPYGGQ